MAITVHSDDTRLQRLARIADTLDVPTVSADATALAQRAAEGRFYVACIGQFKRGKSTLLNALVGYPVLPAAIIPVTAVPTILRYGIEISARVQFTSGDVNDVSASAIESYVSEEQNPENAKGIALVEVFVPSGLLAHGMCLVDTPGVGSVFANNTATTHAFIPHIDAALVVVGADPPISGDELALVQQVGRLVQQLIIVLNKADRFTDAERAEAVAFTSRVLSRGLHRSVTPIHAVSATERLAGEGPARDWPALEEALIALAERAGQGIIRGAVRRGVTRVADACSSEIGMQLRALRQPIEESDRRLAALKSHIADVEFQLPRLNALIAVEQQQIARILSARREDFLAVTIREANMELQTRMPSSAGGTTGRTAIREQALALARHVAQEHLAPWFESEEQFAEQLYRGTATRFIELTTAFLAHGMEPHEVEDNAARGIVDRASRAIDLDPAFTTASRFYFHDVESLVRTASPWPSIVDSLRSRTSTSRDAARRASWYLEQLLRINSTRVHNDIDDRVVESGRRLEVEMRRMLQEVSASAERALQRARLVRADGAERVTGEIHRLEALLAEVDDMRERLL